MGYSLQVLSFGHNPGIFYQFSVPHGSEPSHDAVIVEDDFRGGHHHPAPQNNSSSQNETTSHNRRHHHRHHHSNTPSAMPGYTQSFTFMEKKNTESSGPTGALKEPKTFYKTQSGNVSTDPSFGDNVIPNADGFRWQVTGYTPCSATCGQGQNNIKKHVTMNKNVLNHLRNNQVAHNFIQSKYMYIVQVNYFLVNVNGRIMILFGVWIPSSNQYCRYKETFFGLFLWKCKSGRKELFNGNKTCVGFTTLCIEVLSKMGKPVSIYI